MISGSVSHLAARQRWMDWWMRIFQRNIFNGVAKSVASGIRICNALAPTSLPLDYAAETAKTGPLLIKIGLGLIGLGVTDGIA